MEQTKMLVVSEKIRKADKYFPKKWVINMLEMMDSARDRAYFKYHIETGLRVSDVLATRLEHVDWQQYQTYTFDHKKDKWRHIVWPQSIKGDLKVWLRERQHIIANMGKESKQLLFPFTDKTANRIIKRAAKLSEFPYAKLASSHWCRHTFIRLSRAANRDIKMVQQNTGDSVKTIMKWYAELSMEDMHNEVETRPII